MGDFRNAVTLYTGSVVNGILNIGTSTAATLTLDGTGLQLYSTAVTGATTFDGTLIKKGTGTWTLDESFTYTGGTTINGGTLQIGNGGTTGSIVGNVLDNGSLVFNRSECDNIFWPRLRHGFSYPGRLRKLDLDCRQHLQRRYGDRSWCTAGE